MEKILLDYSEYERLKAIEKQFNGLRSKTESAHGHSHADSSAEISQDGKGNIPTGFLQKVAVTKENGPSDQEILENPTAPILFTSQQDNKSEEKPKSIVANKEQQQQPQTSKRKAARESDSEIPAKWWILE